MPEFDVPIIQGQAAETIIDYILGENGDGPKVDRPDVQPKIVQVFASNKGEAAIIAERLNPDCIAIRHGITKHRDA